MAKPEVPPKAKLFISILYSSDESLNAAEKCLNKKYGPVEKRTDPIPFDHNENFDEIGPDLKKKFILFKKLIRREDIVNIKLFTNKTEEKLSEPNHRTLNIDPGYITLSNVFIASCKEFYHRTYMGRGVYLENEYRYASKKFIFWDWTYPEYKKKEYLDFFYAARKMYHDQIRIKPF